MASPTNQITAKKNIRRILSDLETRNNFNKGISSLQEVLENLKILHPKDFIKSIVEFFEIIQDKKNIDESNRLALEKFYQELAKINQDKIISNIQNLNSEDLENAQTMLQNLNNLSPTIFADNIRRFDEARKKLETKATPPASATSSAASATSATAPPTQQSQHQSPRKSVTFQVPESASSEPSQQNLNTNRLSAAQQNLTPPNTSNLTRDRDTESLHGTHGTFTTSFTEHQERTARVLFHEQIPKQQAQQTTVQNVTLRSMSDAEISQVSNYTEGGGNAASQLRAPKTGNQLSSQIPSEVSTADASSTKDFLSFRASFTQSFQELHGKNIEWGVKAKDYSMSQDPEISITYDQVNGCQCAIPTNDPNRAKTFSTLIKTLIDNNKGIDLDFNMPALREFLKESIKLGMPLNNIELTDKAHKSLAKHKITYDSIVREAQNEVQHEKTLEGNKGKRLH